ncbi:hypothetical protein ES705_50947 [subsurface metagenome]
MATRKGSVKTKFIGGEALATFSGMPPGAPAVYDDWVVQDEITIIGVEISAAFKATSESFALAENIRGYAELSRAGAMERDSSIARVSLETRWATTVVTAGVDFHKQVVVMLPSGRGIDVDEGDVINLIALASAESAQAPPFTAWAIVYYIER